MIEKPHNQYYVASSKQNIIYCIIILNKKHRVKLRDESFFDIHTYFTDYFVLKNKKEQHKNACRGKYTFLSSADVFFLFFF